MVPGWTQVHDPVQIHVWPLPDSATSLCVAGSPTKATRGHDRPVVVGGHLPPCRPGPDALVPGRFRGRHQRAPASLARDGRWNRLRVIGIEGGQLAADGVIDDRRVEGLERPEIDARRHLLPRVAVPGPSRGGDPRHRAARVHVRSWSLHRTGDRGLGDAVRLGERSTRRGAATRLDTGSVANAPLSKTANGVVRRCLGPVAAIPQPGGRTGCSHGRATRRRRGASRPG